MGESSLDLTTAAAAASPLPPPAAAIPPPGTSTSKPTMEATTSPPPAAASTATAIKIMPIAATGNKMQRLQAAAVLDKMTATKFVLWLVITIVVQLSWGLYGVCTRYLQASISTPIPTLQLMVALNLIAWPCLICVYSVPEACLALHKKLRARKAASQQAGAALALADADADAIASHEAGKSLEETGAVVPVVGPGAAAAVEAEAAAMVDPVPGPSPGPDPELGLQQQTRGESAPAVGSNTLQEQQQQQQQQQQGKGIDAATAASAGTTRAAPLKARLGAYFKETAIATGIGAVISMQALTNVYAARFANAYIAQLIFMFAPLVTALGNRALLAQPTPAFLWPTLALSIAGSAMVIGGQWMDRGASGSAGAGSLVLGMALAFLSTILLSLYLILIQVTRHLVSGQAVLWGKRNVAVLLFVPLSLIVDGTDWSWVAQLDGMGWGVLIFTGLYIYTIMNILLQYASRKMGAALVSVFMALRLVSSIVGSIALLHEVPTQALSWVGFAVVILIMTSFLLVQYRAKSRAQRREAARAEGRADPYPDDDLPLWHRLRKAVNRGEGDAAGAAGAGAALPSADTSYDSRKVSVADTAGKDCVLDADTQRRGAVHAKQ